MLKSYNIKLYPNKNKTKKIDNLLDFWKAEVNKKISIFWKFDNVDGAYPPKEHTKGGRLVRDASVKACKIVKGAKKTNQKEMPVFKGNEIDLNEFSAKVIENHMTKLFDIWFNVISLEKYKRLKLPGKKYNKLNKILDTGQIRKSFKLFKKNNSYYITIFVDIPDKKSNNKKIVGIDVGLNQTVTTSDGKFFGSDLKDLRIRTKWRKYNGTISAFKQGLNRIAKELISQYPECDFAVEKLLFKGKHKRSRTFRRRNNNWAYGHLSKQLAVHGKTEGFSVYYVRPEYTSQTCPICNELGKRQYNDFACNICGYKGHADIVGAMNIALRVPQEHPSLNVKPVIITGV